MHQRFAAPDIQKLLSQDIFGKGKEADTECGADCSHDSISETQNGELNASTTNRISRVDGHNHNHLQSVSHNAVIDVQDSDN